MGCRLRFSRLVALRTEFWRISSSQPRGETAGGESGSATGMFEVRPTSCVSLKAEVDSDGNVNYEKLLEDEKAMFRMFLCADRVVKLERQFEEWDTEDEGLCGACARASMQGESELGHGRGVCYATISSAQDHKSSHQTLVQDPADIASMCSAISGSC